MNWLLILGAYSIISSVLIIQVNVVRSGGVPTVRGDGARKRYSRYNETVRGARSPRSGLANKPKAKAGSPRPSPVRRLRHSRVACVWRGPRRCAAYVRSPAAAGRGGIGFIHQTRSIYQIRRWRWRFPILRGPCHISADTACYTRKRGPCLRHGTSDTSSPTNGVVLQIRWHADEASGPLRTGHCGCTWLGASLGRHE